MIAKVTTHSTEPRRNGAKKPFGKLPGGLLAEIESFRQRNQIGENQHCPRCLKAHALKKAKEMKLSEGVFEHIEEMFDCEAGHMGYYRDGDEILEIES